MSNNPVSFIDPDGGYDHMTDEQIAARDEERRRKRYEETWDRASDQGRSPEYSGARSNSGQLGASMRTEAEYMEYMRETVPSSQTIRHFDTDVGMPWDETVIQGGYGSDGGPQGPPRGRTMPLPQGIRSISLVPAELVPWLNTGPLGAILQSTAMGEGVPLSTIAQWEAQFALDKKNNELVTLYRGVQNLGGVNAFQYGTALLGMAVPRGITFNAPTHVNPERHTQGFTSNSLVTSWTQSPSFAAAVAKQGKPGDVGIVLSKQFPRWVLSQKSLTSLSPDFEHEFEILILGVQIGAHVELLR